MTGPSHHVAIITGLTAAAQAADDAGDYTAAQEILTSLPHHYRAAEVQLAGAAPGPTDGLTPAAAAQMGMLLDSLGAVEPTREQIQALRWLSGWEVHTVHAIAALLRTTGTRRSLTTAVHPCPHTGVYAEADTTETPLRVIADDGNDLDGIVVQVVPV